MKNIFKEYIENYILNIADYLESDKVPAEEALRLLDKHHAAVKKWMAEYRKLTYSSKEASNAFTEFINTVEKLNDELRSAMDEEE